VVNQSLVNNHTVWQPGFNIPHQMWYVLDCFCTNHGHCAANLHKCSLASSDECRCGTVQTLSHGKWVS